MSLINQMLKDLEKRSKPLSVPDYFISGLRSNSSGILKNNTRMIVIVSILILIAFSVYLFNRAGLSHHGVKNAPAQATQNLVSTNAGTQGVISTPAHANTVTLTGITLEVQNDLTDLRLLLSQNALYSVSRDEKERLIIVLEQTQLVANIPSFVNNMDSALDGLEMINLEDGNLKIVFTLKEGAELSHLDLNASRKLPELQIIFQYKPKTTMATEYDNTLPEPVILERKEGSIKKLRYDVSLDERYQLAMELASENKVNEAIASFKKILNQDPGYSPARAALVSLLLKKGEVEQVQQILNYGLALQPHYTPYIKLQAEVLVQQGKVNDALKFLLTSPPEIQTDTEYYAFIAALYQQNEQFQLAKELYERLLTIKPNNATWWMGLGISLDSIGERRQAIDAFQMASRDASLTPEIKDYVEARLSALQ